MDLRQCVFICLSLFSSIVISSQECVSKLLQLKAKLRKAKVGDVICIAKGVHKDWLIKVKKHGVTITGEEGGKVVMTGESRVIIYRSNVKIANLSFTAPLNWDESNRKFKPPLNFDRHSKNSEIYNCEIRNHAATVWAKVRGEGNSLHHCIFRDKPVPVIGTPSEIVYVGHSTMYGNSVHHNRFENYDPDALVNKHKHDGAEAVFVKVSRVDGRETVDRRTKVHHNYFYKIDAEQETIGIKSSGNEVYENAIEDCYGGISLRHGKRNTVRRNYIKMRNIHDRDNFGITAHDSDHIIEENWVIDAGMNNGITVTGSNGETTCNACHVRAKNVLIKKNVLVNSALRIGKLFEGPVENYQPPENITVDDLQSSCKYSFGMIGGTEVCKDTSFLGHPTTFTGVNKFSGPSLTSCSSMKNFKKVFKSKKVIWKTRPDDLGSKGERKIREIKCAAGPSWFKGC